MHKKFRRDVKSLFSNMTDVFRNKKRSLVMLIRNTKNSHVAKCPTETIGSCMICNDGAMARAQTNRRASDTRKVVHTSQTIGSFRIDASVFALNAAKQNKITSV